MKRIIKVVLLLLVSFDLFATEFTNILNKELSIVFIPKNTYAISSYKNVYITLWKKNLNEYEDEPGSNTSQSLKELLRDINSSKEIEHDFGNSFKINRTGNFIFIDYFVFSRHDPGEITLEHNFIIFSGNTAIVIKMAFYKTWGDERYKELKNIFKKYSLVVERGEIYGKSKDSEYDNGLIWTSYNEIRAAELIREEQIKELNDWYFNTREIINVCVKNAK